MEDFQIDETEIRTFPARVHRVNDAERRESLLERLSSFGPILSIFAYFIFDVVLVGAKKEVRRVTAETVIACMKHMETIGDWAVSQLPCNTVRCSGGPVNRQLSVTVTASARCPIPAVSRTKFIDSFPESRCNRLTIIVPTNESPVQTWGLWLLQPLSTTAFAEFWRRRRGSAVLVADDVANRLSTNPATTAIRYFGDSGFLSAPAMTKAVGDFLRRLLGGMIVHVVSASSAVGHATGRFQRRGGAFVGVFRSNYTTDRGWSPC